MPLDTTYSFFEIIMVEEALYSALNSYNREIKNNYGVNWGSLMDFIGNLA